MLKDDIIVANVINNYEYRHECEAGGVDGLGNDIDYNIAYVGGN